MIDNLINEIEQAMLNVLDNEQLSQLRKVLDYTFRNISVTKKESVHTESNNQALIDNFIAAKKVASLLVHNHKEVTHLNKILPKLYAEYGSKSLTAEIQ